MYSLVFFFKQKTAYEMRISDWSSDVCSSDLVEQGFRLVSAAKGQFPEQHLLHVETALAQVMAPGGNRLDRLFLQIPARIDFAGAGQIGLVGRRIGDQDSDPVRPRIVRAAGRTVDPLLAGDEAAGLAARAAATGIGIAGPGVPRTEE